MDLSQRIVGQNKSLGQTLVEAGVMNEEQLRHVTMLTRKNGYKTEHILLQQRFLTPQQLAILIAFQSSIPFINVKKQPINPAVVRLIPESMARKYGVMPIDTVDGAIVVAMEDPENDQAITDLGSYTGKQIEPVVGIAKDIQEVIDRTYQVAKQNNC